MKVSWPGISVNKVETWKVLELSGLASSSRKAQIFVRSGYVYKDNILVTSLRDMMDVGHPTLLSIRFPSGQVIEDSITVVNKMYSESSIHRKGDLE